MARKNKPAEASELDLSLAVRAAWLSYIGGRTQGQIAERLNISQAKVHRLIAEALSRGLVKVFVQGEPADCIALEDALTCQFGLKRCIVAPDLGRGELAGGELSEAQQVFAAIGSAAARFLHRELACGAIKVIGVGKGRSLAAMVERLPRIRRPDLKVVSVSGSLTRSLAANPLDIVMRLAGQTEAAGYFLPVPYLAKNLTEKSVLLAQDSIRSMLDLARQADLVLVGIGSLEGDAHLRQVGMIADQEWADLNSHGAVGDLMGSFIDAEGRPVASAVNQLSVGLGLQDLCGKQVIAVAGGMHKAEAILAALKTGTLTGLVTDERTAAAVVELARRKSEAA
ncbi:MAG TPA: sugar-binding transcriptional regulator [Dongiaceae bacterium]|nr:sugar-binding transcriptional regulator [Dongiaceae bacterium]